MKHHLPKHRISFILLLLFFSVGSFSCLKSKKPGIPADVVNVIDETGANRIEFTKTIANYFESPDSLKTRAAYFLIANIGRQYSVDYEVVDSNGSVIIIDPMHFNNAENYLNNWKSIQDSLGALTYKPRKYYLDRDTITSELLITNIENTFDSRNFSWTKTYSDEDVFRYVLPYRIGNEYIEDWRTHIKKEFAWLIDSAKTLDSPEKIADLVNEYVNHNYHFDQRYIKSPQIQTIKDLLINKIGNYQDLSYLKTKILRSLGIPSTVDYVPFLADSVNSFFMSIYLNSKGKFVPLLNEDTEYLLYSSSKIPKVYRRIYHEIDSSLFALKEINVKTPPYLGHYHYLDVTNEYFPTQNLSFYGSCPDSLIYIAVLNENHWNAVDWSICKNNEATFNKIVPGITYKFAFMNNDMLQVLSEEPIKSNN